MLRTAKIFGITNGSVFVSGDTLIVNTERFLDAKIALPKGTRFTVKAISADSIFFASESLIVFTGASGEFVRVFLPSGSFNLVHKEKLNPPPIRVSDGRPLGRIAQGKVFKEHEGDHAVLTKNYTHRPVGAVKLVGWYADTLSTLL